MSLPIRKNFPPMEAQPATDLPAGSEWHYEPKWDGFRCLAFRDDDKIELLSKSQKPLTRYFPELVAELRSLKAEKFVHDGEIVISLGGKPDQETQRRDAVRFYRLRFAGGRAGQAVN